MKWNTTPSSPLRAGRISRGCCFESVVEDDIECASVFIVLVSLLGGRRGWPSDEAVLWGGMSME
jgi:hypothetical protein